MVIEWVQTATSEWVPIEGGIQLASRRDPHREATRWVDSISSQIAEYRAVIVLGVGAGIHISRLSEHYPHIQIHGIDNNQELIKRSLHHHSSANVSYSNAQKLEDLLEDKRAVSLLSNLYGVFVFIPAVRHKSQWYTSLRNQLLGNDADSFTRLCELRPELATLANRIPLSGLRDENANIKKLFLSWIHDLDLTRSPRTLGQTSCLILKELAK